MSPVSDSPTITLRGQRHDDWETLYGLLNQEEILRWTDDLPHMSEDAFREQYANTTPGVHRLIGEITLSSGRKRVVGFARLYVPGRRRRHTAELRWFVHPEYHGSALEGQFLERLIDFAEEWLGLTRLQTVIRADHARMYDVLSAHGFAPEVTLRRYVFQGGAYRDGLLMARLRGALEDGAAPAEPTPHPSGGSAAPVLVRGIEEADWEDIADLLQGERVIYHTLKLPYESRDRVRDRLENLPEDVHFLVAELEGRVVGQVTLHLRQGRRAHSGMLAMMVRDDYQGQGIGSALLEAALDLGERWLGLTRISLEVFTDNQPAIALYRKYGFEIEGTLRRYAMRDGVLVDSYLMARVTGEDRP